MQGATFSAGLTHSHQILTAARHDRAEDQHISQENVSAEVSIMSSTHSQPHTQDRKEAGAKILLLPTFKEYWLPPAEKML